ncbi:hypothetical protein M378DRAFT_16873 [Amanita muscaria Koide BX008]|uniref:Uncharacterized protein n=1 Tax=Amanita muscaria (strain Koide BX008) TaxID=946122 RepID=A0A0C2S210_AMAMK|nr:hypothetical protein M378DRAFT_16873 [Amanita muscaria Koide BX008]
MPGTTHRYKSPLPHAVAVSSPAVGGWPQNPLIDNHIFCSMDFLKQHQTPGGSLNGLQETFHWVQKPVCPTKPFASDLVAWRQAQGDLVIHAL